MLGRLPGAVMPHTPWYTRSRRRQEAWKARAPGLPEAARAAGHTWVEERGRPKRVGPFPICLPERFAEHNLLPGIREAALERFARHGIQWHHGTPRDGSAAPSTHLLDSQVQCVNAMLSWATGPALLQLAQAVEPAAVALAAVEDGHPVTFEWMGLTDHLGEWRWGRPPRGRYATSVDALLVAERDDGGRTALVVEWKFTESYAYPVRPVGRGGTDRRAVYAPTLARSEAFVDPPAVAAFLHEPHYQLLRLGLLAEGMVRTGELGVDRAVLVHVVPGGNAHLRSTVPPALRDRGEHVAEVWKGLLPGGSVRFRALDPTPWFDADPALAERYGAQAAR